MSTAKDHIRNLLALLEMERREEVEQYRIRFLETPLEERRKKGQTWHPVRIGATEVGLGGHLLIDILRPSSVPPSVNPFSTGSVVSLFSLAGAPKGAPPSTTGVVVRPTSEGIRIALHEEELPDWAEEGSLGIDLYFDERSYQSMERALRNVLKAENDRLSELREMLAGDAEARFRKSPEVYPEGLNESQCEALNRALSAEDTALIHGPPGTGKTTTLVRTVHLTCKEEKRVLVCAASNLAVDYLTEKLAERGLKVLRLGHPARLSESVLMHGMDARSAIHPAARDVKDLRKEADKVRRQALKFKRNFGRDERMARRDALSEARALQKQARDIERFIVDDLLSKAQVVLCTLTGADHDYLERLDFRTVFIDEAAQATEPACWIAIARAERVIFAGDHMQLPPTVKSREAAAGGLEVTLFERLMERKPETGVMLRTQYRMHEAIMAFSNHKFYHDGLAAHESVRLRMLPGPPEDPLISQPITFIDTAGCGYDEVKGKESRSSSNPDEGALLLRHLGDLLSLLPKPGKSYKESDIRIAIISPYKDQVNFLRDALKEEKPLWPWQSQINVDTVDGFQGQERDIVYISLVRSNDNGEIGFLRDYRRMNVAMTRAKMRLVIFGDSATLSTDSFFAELIEFIQEKGDYRSAWEFVEF